MMQIKDVLMKIHEDIQNQRKRLLYMKNKIEEQQEIIKIWELEQISDIADAVNENGKPVFSNETKRQPSLNVGKRKTRSIRRCKRSLNRQSLNTTWA